MADVLNRTTKEYKKSVNTPDFPEIDWIVGPDLTGLVLNGQVLVPVKYWKITGDLVTGMSQPEKDVVDAANPIVKRLPGNVRTMRCSFGGQAISGRMLEFSPGIFFGTVAVASTLSALTFNTAQSATATINLFKSTDLVTPIASISLSAQDVKTTLDLSVTLAEGDQLCAIVSGTVDSPSLLVYLY